MSNQNQPLIVYKNGQILSIEITKNASLHTGINSIKSKFMCKFYIIIYFDILLFLFYIFLCIIKSFILFA